MFLAKRFVFNESWVRFAKTYFCGVGRVTGFFGKNVVLSRGAKGFHFLTNLPVRGHSPRYFHSYHRSRRRIWLNRVNCFALIVLNLEFRCDWLFEGTFLLRPAEIRLLPLVNLCLAHRPGHAIPAAKKDGTLSLAERLTNFSIAKLPIVQGRAISDILVWIWSFGHGRHGERGTTVPKTSAFRNFQSECPRRYNWDVSDSVAYGPH